MNNDVLTNTERLFHIDDIEYEKYNRLKISLDRDTFYVYVCKYEHIGSNEGGPFGVLNIHSHLSYEIFIGINNGNRLLVNKQFFTLNEGDIMVIAPGIYHTCFGNRNPGGLFDIRISADEKSKKRENNILSKIKTNVVLKNLHHIKDLVFKLLDEGKDKRWCYLDAIKQLTGSILISILRASRENQMDTAHEIRLAKEVERMEKAEIFFISNYNRNVSLNEFAERLNVGERQAERIVREIYGRSFNQQLKAMRLEKSKELLINTTLRMDEISKQVGYNMPRTFYTMFKQAEGIPPRSYRALYGKKIYNKPKNN